MSRRVCVFCGSSSGNRPEHRANAEALGRELARRGHGLVFGGGHVGLMGVIADAVLAAGGEVIGVIPEALRDRELAHEGVTELVVTADMHSRKARMAALCGAFIAMPGGLGTYEELFEVVTWAQLGFHDKPIGLLDSEGYFQPLIALLDHAVKEGFVRQHDRELFHRSADPKVLLDELLPAR